MNAIIVDCSVADRVWSKVLLSGLARGLTIDGESMTKDELRNGKSLSISFNIYFRGYAMRLSIITPQAAVPIANISLLPYTLSHIIRNRIHSPYSLQMPKRSS